MESSNTYTRQLGRYYMLLIIIITLLIGLSLTWNLVEENKDFRGHALIQARESFDKDVLYRKWNASHGGVYVPVTEETKPNEYLEHIPERDIETPSGKKLTLINPAYMTRQVHELGLNELGLSGHITSLNPIRLENKASDWEEKALLLFEDGFEEYSEIHSIGDEQYMLFMKPLITESRCLKCHEAQGYSVGDIRGGISVSVSLSLLKELSRNRKKTLVIVHSGFWALLLLLMLQARKRMTKLEQKRLRAEQAIISNNENLEKKILQRTKDIEDKNIELEEKNNSLEKFNNLFIGREFRIKELRDKVKELQDLLSKK